ncbi:TolC family protein [Ekhidna sp.]|uniref:TolC family protein n=1 Tax=Ekhidna sp. TaxID=2608089 RepID=UPI003B511948
MKKLIFSLGILCLSISYGQDQLSLSDAIQIGLRRNYGILIEKGNVEVATNNNDWGQAGRWPTISLTVNQNNNVTDNVKVAFPTATQGQTRSNSLNPQFNVNWTLFDGFRANITKKRLELLQAESQGNASVVIANTLQSIILGYYLAVLENERLNEFEKQLTLSRDKYDYIRVKSDLGGAVTTDVLLEEGNYLTDSINYINQQLAYRNAVRDLNVLLAEENVAKNYVFTDSLQLPDETYTFDDLRSQMIQENVDLQKQYITQTLLGEATKLSYADRYPSLALNASFSENRNSLDLSEAVFFTGNGFSSGPDTRLNSVTDNYTASFTLSYTLFNGGKINRAIKNAIVNERVGQLRVDQLETSLDRDLLSALDRYNIRRQLYAINARREDAAQTNLDLSEAKFRNGSINSFDYRDVQNNYLSSSILKLQAAYNLINSKIELMRLTGGMIREYQN